MNKKRVATKPKVEHGFSFLELTFVVTIISFIFYLGIDVYLKQIDKSLFEALRFQANTFSRTINNLRASALIGNANFIILDNKNIYINEAGWPANTDRKMSAKSWNQTSQECQQLWQALYEIPPESILNISERKSTSEYLITSINGRICRYELLRKQDGAYFFDYHLDTGKVIAMYK